MSEDTKDGQAHEGDADHHQHGGIGLYIAIYVALLVLTGVTVGLAYIDLGGFTLTGALLVAFTKATLVAVWFMHLRGSSTLNTLALLGALFWLIVLIVLTMPDYVARPPAEFFQ